MPMPIPGSGDIAARGAAVFEQALPGIDARTPNTLATTYTRVLELEFFELWFYLAYIARELFVTTAVDYLPDHATIWNVPRNQATAASGNLIVNATAGDPVPEGVVFSLSGSNITWVSTAAVPVTVTGTVSVPVEAQVTGAAGNLPAGTQLTITSPVAGVSPQIGTVDSDGVAGGNDIESIDSWRARILAVIRQRPMGGALNDYVEWAEAALTDVGYVNPVPLMYGLGTVGVPFLMSSKAGPVVPTTEQIAAVQAYLDTVRPVTAQVTAMAGVLNPVNVTLHLNPDTTTIRAAATTALQYFFLQSAEIGATTYFSRLDNAISSGDGEYSHELIAPAADVPAPSNITMNVLGAVNFT